MGDPSSDFLNQFYNLEGDSVPDTKKKFFKFLRQPQFAAHKDEIHDALDKLEPKNYLQGLLKVDALIYFKKADILLEHLQKGTNEIYTSKIIKQKWFLEEVFGSFDVDKFVNEFLPQTSFSLRMKLIKQIASIWSEQNVDQLYDQVFNRYGYFVAKIIVDKCSHKKLEDVLSENKTILTPNQIIHLFDRDVELFKLYVSHNKKLKGRRFDEKKVLSHVALKNPILLMALQKQEIIDHDMGRRTTKRAFHLIKDDLENAERYLQYMNKAVLVRKWGDKFQIVYRKIFPTEVDAIYTYSSYFRLLGCYPKSKRWSVFLNVFSYNIGIEKLPRVYVELENDFLSISNPPREVVQKWACEHYKSNPHRYLNYLKYYETQEAIKMLKEKINFTSHVNKRDTLLKIMIGACAENNDLKALEEVLKYLCVRHRNEEHFVIRHVLEHLKESFKMETLTQSHWQCINELTNVLRVHQKHENNVCKDLTQHYLQFLVKNKQPYEDVLIQYIKDVVSLQYSYDFSIKDPAVFSILYKGCIELYSKAVDRSVQAYRTFFSALIEQTVKFGRKNIKFAVKLDEYPCVLEFASEIFGKTDNFDNVDFQFITSLIEHHLLFSSILIDEDTLLQTATKIYINNSFIFPTHIYAKAILKKSRSDFENKILKLYFDIIFNKQSDRKVLSWFLVNEPSVLKPYLNKIIEKLIKTEIDTKHVLAMKYYPQFNLDEKCIIFYKNLLKDLEALDENQIVRSMKYLSLLLETDEFIAIINDKFLPKKNKLDLEDKKMVQFYKPQCEVVKKLHRMQEPNKLLPVVMKFCTGDYLKSATPSLYSLFCRCQEQQLYDKIDSLSKGAVSVKKHALFLSCQVLDTQRITKILLNSTSSKSSEQKHVFSALFKYFMKNPCQSLFDLVIKNLYTIDKNDIEIRDYLQNARLPEKYKVPYLEECWAFFERLKKHNVKIDSYLTSLFERIVNCRETIEKLSINFIEKIINLYFRDVDEELRDIEHFICRILRYRVSEQTINFQKVFGIIKEFNPERLYKFYLGFVNTNANDVDILFIERFYEQWKKSFLIKDAFRETMGLQLLLSYHKSENNQIHIQNIVTYMEQLISSEYGPYSITMYARILIDHVLKVTNYDYKKVYQFYLDILNYKNNIHTCTLALLVVYKFSDDDGIELYNELQRILASSEDSFVQIYYKQYF